MALPSLSNVDSGLHAIIYGLVDRSFRIFNIKILGTELRLVLIFFYANLFPNKKPQCTIMSVFVFYTYRGLSILT